MLDLSLKKILLNPGVQELSGIIIIFTSLSSSSDRNNFPTGHFPKEVINFTDVNSPYNDYNSNAPVIFGQYSFKFSSNRKSKSALCWY